MSGGVEDWRIGGVEEWRSGGVDEGRSGGVDGSKDQFSICNGPRCTPDIVIFALVIWPRYWSHSLSIFLNLFVNIRTVMSTVHTYLPCCGCGPLHMMSSSESWSSSEDDGGPQMMTWRGGGFPRGLPG